MLIINNFVFLDTVGDREERW